VREISRLTRWSRPARIVTDVSYCASRDSCAVDRYEDGRLMYLRETRLVAMKQVKQHQAAFKTTSFPGGAAAWPYKPLTDQL